MNAVLHNHTFSALKERSAGLGVVCLTLRLFYGAYWGASSGIIMSGKSSLRRRVVSDGWFFVSCTR